MKLIKLSSFLILSSLLLTACNNSNTSDEKPAENVATQEGKTVQTGTMKVAYINTDTLSSRYELIADVEEEIIARRMTMESQYQSLVQDLQKDYNDAQQGAAGLSDEALAILQQKLAMKEQQVMQQKSMMENDLMQFEQEKTTAYLEKVQGFIADYAKEHGYDMIYGFNGLNNLLYIDKGYDVTDDVINAINVAYQNEKQPADKES